MKMGTGAASTSWVQRWMPGNHALLVASLWVLVTLCGVAVSRLLSTPFLASMIACGVGLGALLSVAVLAVQLTGATRPVRGSDADRWTFEELKRLGRRGWRLVADVELDGRHVDLVLLGPGGAFALESEWLVPVPYDVGVRPLLVSAAQRAKAGARSLGLWHQTDFCPVVVVWGPGDLDVTAVEEAVVVPGTALRTWADGLGDGALGIEDVERIRERLESYVARHSARADSAGHAAQGSTPWPLGIALAVAGLCLAAALAEVLLS